MRYVFFVNPAAGKNDAYMKIIPQIEEYLNQNGAEYKIVFSSAKGDIQQKARAEAEKGDEVVIFACGGEGTCFEVLNGVAGYDNVTISEIPTGSANDFLKSFGNEYKNCFADIKQLINGITVKMDVIKADEFYCLNGCSVGMDAVVGRDMAIFKNWPLVNGSLAYKLAIVKTFFSKLGAVLEIKVDGVHKYTKNCLFAVVGNGVAYGGGYYATPKAVPFDEKLDFTVVETISRLKILKFLKTYERGQHENLACCDLGTCSSLEFKTENEIPINLDGEIIERKEMKFEIKKQFVKFLLPEVFKDKDIFNKDLLTKKT